MLVLSRQKDESIMIGDEVEITIVDVRGDKVRLGITAPNTIPVHRKEVYEAIQRENREAARVKMEDMASLPKGAVKPVPPGLHRPHVPAARPQRDQPPSTPPAAGTTPPANGNQPAEPGNPPSGAPPAAN